MITINRPERKNAILLAMRTELERAFQQCQDDFDVRAIILTGAGTDFSAGADVGEMGGGGVREFASPHAPPAPDGPRHRRRPTSR